MPEGRNTPEERNRPYLTIDGMLAYVDEINITPPILRDDASGWRLVHEGDVEFHISRPTHEVTMRMFEDGPPDGLPEPTPEPEPDPEPEPFMCRSCRAMYREEPTVQAAHAALCSHCVNHYGARICPECEWNVMGRYSRHRDPEGNEMCSGCFNETYRMCNGCHEARLEEDVLHFPNMYLCTGCWETGYWRECASCECALDADDLRYREGHGQLCNACIRELGPVRAVSYNVDGEGVRGTRSFGVEIEVEFGYDEEDVPWSLGYYHSNDPAPEDTFFSGWRGEYDGSLDGGGEFISPPIQGAGGLAEVISTMSTLRSYDAEIRDTCGQHITVHVGGYEDQGLVQRLSMALEESLFATTGAYGRMAHNSYAERLKDDAGSYIQEGNIYGSRTCICGVRDHNGTVEFRYPPGTLIASQAAINVGLTQLVVQLATRWMTESEIDELVERSMELELDDTIPRAERLHRQVMLGLELFARLGQWKSGGEYHGLPYDPTNPPTIEIREGNNYCGNDTVTLPSEERIQRRLERQISRFYRSMGGKPEHMIEALKTLGITPRPVATPTT